jgi:Mg2+ and Co2+ transporter CorA
MTPEKNSRQDIAIAELQKDISYIRETIASINNTINNFIRDSNSKFITRTEFEPVKRFSEHMQYWLIGIALSMLSGAGVIVYILQQIK